MKLAFANNGTLISEHFGHCSQFTIYEVDEEKVINKELIDNPGHKPGFLPLFLKDNGISVVVAGGMGNSAQQLFINNNIQVIVGINGECDEAIKNFLKGQLKSTNSVCSEHQHKGDCKGH